MNHINNATFEDMMIPILNDGLNESTTMVLNLVNVYENETSSTNGTLQSSHYYYQDGQVIEQRWHIGFIFFAYWTAFIGAYSAIRLLEHGLWRSDRERENATFISKYPRLGTAIVLGSCTIWSMHFIGMQAVVLQHVQVCYSWVPTAISLCLSITGVYAGVAVASLDLFSGEDRIEVLKHLLQDNRHVASKMNRQRANCHIHMVALFHKLHWIAFGSALAALGALSMHYVGMIAMKGAFRREWSISYITGSVGLGVIVCFAGFWILFRPLHWKVEKSWYRYASAAIIALAVCALHFLGMLSVTYIYDSSKHEVCGEKRGIQNWQPDQLKVLCVAILVPFVAFLVEHSISNELRVTYRQLLDIRLTGSQFMPTNSRGSGFANRSSTMGTSMSSSRYSVGGGGRRSTSCSVKISGLPPSVIMGSNVDSSDVMSASRGPASRLSMISEDSNMSGRHRFWDSLNRSEDKEDSEIEDDQEDDKEEGDNTGGVAGHDSEDLEQGREGGEGIPAAGDMREREVDPHPPVVDGNLGEVGRESTASLSDSSSGASSECQDSVRSLPIEGGMDDSVPSLEPFKRRESFLQDVVNDFMDMSESSVDIEFGPKELMSHCKTDRGQERQDSVGSLQREGRVDHSVPRLDSFKRRASILQDVVKDFMDLSESCSDHIEAGPIDITSHVDRDKCQKRQDSARSLPMEGDIDDPVPSLDSFKRRASVLQDVVKDFMHVSESCTDLQSDPIGLTSNSDSDKGKQDLCLSPFQQRRGNLMEEVVIEFNESAESSEDQSSPDKSSQCLDASANSALGRVRRVVSKIDSAIDSAFEDFSIGKSKTVTPSSKGKRILSRIQSVRKMNAKPDHTGSATQDTPNSFPQLDFCT